jgi:hypothetical protein
MATTTQAPLKVRQDTKEKIRYLSALEDATQAEIVDRAVTEYAARHATEIENGIARARSVLASGDVATAAYLLDVPIEDVAAVAGQSTART